MYRCDRGNGLHILATFRSLIFPVFKKTALIPIVQIVMVGIIILLVFLAETLRFFKGQDFHKSSEIFVSR